jgi:hypothetical protein
MGEKLSKPEKEEVTSEKITKKFQLSIVIIGTSESGKFFNIQTFK